MVLLLLPTLGSWYADASVVSCLRCVPWRHSGSSSSRSQVGHPDGQNRFLPEMLRTNRQRRRKWTVVISLQAVRGRARQAIAYTHHYRGVLHGSKWIEVLPCFRDGKSVTACAVVKGLEQLGAGRMWDFQRNERKSCGMPHLVVVGTVCGM